MNVVLFGMKHCGKSTVGQCLATRWSCPFYDVDQMIEQWHTRETKEHLSFREIMASYGEDYFREVEGNVVRQLNDELCEAQSTAVVALGGRTALNTSINALLGDIGVRIYLQVSPDELWTRVERSGIPAFLEGDDPQGRFLALCQKRHPRYEQQADLTVDLDGLDPGESVDLLERRIEEHARGGQ